MNIYRDSIQKIGDVMKQFAPFLKLYTEYVKNFDNAMNVITQWQDKSPKFAELLLSLQVCMAPQLCNKDQINFLQHLEFIVIFKLHILFRKLLPKSPCKTVVLLPSSLWFSSASFPCHNSLQYCLVENNCCKVCTILLDKLSLCLENTTL